MERGASPAGVDVAVPSTIWPLPGDQPARELLGPWIVGIAQPAGSGQSQAVLAGAVTGKPTDDAVAGVSSRSGEPVQDMVDGGADARVVSRGRQVGEGYQAPEAAGPLAVRVHAEAAIVSLALQESTHQPVGEELRGHVVGPFPQHVARSQVAQNRLRTIEQPVEGSCIRRGGR
jgi:hypothetical protein